MKCGRAALAQRDGIQQEPSAIGMVWYWESSSHASLLISVDVNGSLELIYPIQPYLTLIEVLENDSVIH